MMSAFCLIAFMAQWNSLFWPQIVLQAQDRFSLPIGPSQMVGAYRQETGLLMAGTLLAILPVMALFLLLQRECISGSDVGGGEGVAPAPDTAASPPSPPPILGAMRPADPRRGALLLLACLGAAAGCGGAEPVVRVGDPAERVWQVLHEQGHQIARIPLDGRIEDRQPNVPATLVGMIRPYAVNGRVILFSHDFASGTIAEIATGDLGTLTEIDVTRSP